MSFQYPSHLLHSSDFQLIDFEEYRTDAVLIRHTENKDIWDDNELLKAEYIAAQTDHLRDYSTNLLGIFQLEDIGEFTCHVLHTPINVNVWHCSLRWFNNTGEDSSLLSKSQRRRMLAAAKSHIISHAFQF
jgi:hypothetical protein